MPNHVHLLITSGETGISTMMQSLLTRYASYFNRRDNRSGKLFTNRFKSVLCDRDDYLLQLVRYIHLNPLRARLVSDMDGLDRYLWTGHSTYMGIRKDAWLETDEILGMFGRQRKRARQAYRTFVEEVLRDSESREERRSKLRRQGWTMERVLARAAEVVGLEAEDLMRRGRSDSRSQGRALAYKWISDDLGEQKARIAEWLGVSRMAVTKLVRRGAEIESDLGAYLDAG